MKRRRNRGWRLLRFLGEVVVNGPMTPLSTKEPPAEIVPEVPELPRGVDPPDGWRQVLEKEGPEGFVKAAREHGVDVFRILDCLNYIENLKLGMDAVGEAGGVIEASLCYTGDVSDPARTKYSLQYYVDLAGALVERGTHVLAIKDMAGLLKPRAGRMLVTALRDAFPEVPIHVHTHDTASTGVASMLACAPRASPVTGVVKRLVVASGDEIKAGDLLCEIEVAS